MKLRITLTDGQCIDYDIDADNPTDADNEVEGIVNILEWEGYSVAEYSLGEEWGGGYWDEC